MKLKRWLSRALVLAMVVALMIPVPVAAKSNGGGKLVKSVAVYSINDDATKWVPSYKTTYTYDKKNNPKEVKTVHYYNVIFDSIPTGGSTTTDTFKFKYKGKTTKSLKVLNDAGYVDSSRQYNKGKVAKVYSDYIDIVKDEKTKAFVDNSEHYLNAYAYDKNGLVTVRSFVGTGNAGTTESNYTYFIQQKKGIPSYIFESFASGKFTDKTGKVEPYTASKSGWYETYNGKGLAVQGGYYDAETGKYNANYTIQYVMKKGKVAEAIVFEIVDGKEKPVTKYVFKYGKTSVSKARYMKMINSFVSDMPFFWY